MSQPHLPRPKSLARRRFSLAALSALILVVTITVVRQSDRPGHQPTGATESQRELSHSSTDFAPQRGSLLTTIERLDSLAAEFEDQKDVKCWTSFKLLETFIAGCQLRPETTHLKTEVVMNYLDQIWISAEHEATSPIDAETLRQTAQQIMPWESDSLFEYRVALRDRTVTLRYQDVQNYQGTVEPIRLLRALAGHLSASGSPRIDLSPNAIDEATHLAALLSTLVLVEANAVAQENRHQDIQNDDLFQADRRIASALSLVAFDPARRKQEHTVAPSSRPSDRYEPMLAIVRQKIQSLDTFNNTYSRNHLGQTFVADLSDHEEEWARLPVDSQASEAYKTSDLVDLAEFLYQRCAKQNPDSASLNGSQMLSTILRLYPSISHFEHGTIHLYPNDPTIEGLKVEEYEADAFRDSAAHWRAIEGMLLRIIENTTASDLPSMDHYALEELSEFLSVFSVAYVKLAGQLARNQGKVSVVNRIAFKAARRLFVRASQHHLETRRQSSTAPPNHSDTGTNERSAIREILATTYIEDLFSDVTANTGIDFRHETSRRAKRHRFDQQEQRPQDLPGYVARAKHLREHGYPSEIPKHSLGIEGGGVAVADIDGDGLLDIYLVSGGADRLYRNLGKLRFKDVTEQSGLGDDAEGRGAYFIDYDNDGDQDLFVTQVYSANRLLQNQGDGTFVDVTLECGLPQRSDLVSHSAVWFDFDNDGHLDVYVANYGDWLGDELPLVQADSRNGQPNSLYRNKGAGTFEDITAQTGAGDVGWAQAVSHFDMNNDGWQDLYIANDFGQDLILINEAGQRFTKHVMGEGNYLHGMSVGFTDINGDGTEDIYVSNISTFSFASKHIKPDATTRIAASQRTTQDMRMIENNLFLVSDSNGYHEQHHEFFDRSREGSGWAWDADFFDFDNDGKEDLYILNGREPNLSYANERNVLYKQSNRHFYDVSSGSGADFKSNARGAVHADLDGDGDLDLVINNYQGNAVVLRNNLQFNNWIRLRLRGTRSNRDAVGARVTLHTQDGTQLRTVRGGSGFLSKEDNTLHFGLKSLRTVEAIDVFWPSGQHQRISDLPVNREHLIVEPRITSNKLLGYFQNSLREERLQDSLREGRTFERPGKLLGRTLSRHEQALPEGN